MIFSLICAIVQSDWSADLEIINQGFVVYVPDPPSRPNKMAGGSGSGYETIYAQPGSHFKTIIFLFTSLINKYILGFDAYVTVYRYMLLMLYFHSQCV